MTTCTSADFYAIRPGRYLPFRGNWAEKDGNQEVCGLSVMAARIRITSVIVDVILRAVVVIGGLIFPASGWGGKEADATPAAAYLMNLSNYGAFGYPTGSLGPTWTLAVEEQFYLVWPVLLLLMLRFWKARTGVWVTAVPAAAFLVARFLLVLAGASLPRLYNGSDTRANESLLRWIPIRKWHSENLEPAVVRPALKPAREREPAGLSGK